MTRPGQALGCAIIALLATSAPAAALAPLPSTISVAPAPGSPFVAGFRPNEVFATDVNRDGRDDVVAATGSNPGTIAVLVSDPSGGLTQTAASPIPTTAGAPLDALDMADLNGDGNLDVVAGTAFGTDNVVVLLGDGTGGFTETGPSPISLGSAGHSPYSLHIVDITGDGKLDVITANYQPNQDGTVSILQGDGAGGLTLLGTPLLSGGGTDNVHDVAAIDLNGDSRLDLVSLHYEPDGVQIRLNSQIGFGVAGPLINAGPAADSVIPIDLDRDGDQDLVFANTIGNSDITALRNEGNGTLGAYPGFPIDTGAQAGYGLVSADVDADGLPDIASSHDAGSNTPVELSLLVAQGGGAFGPVTGSPFLFPGAVRGTSLAVGDFNGDAQPDFAVSDNQPVAGSDPGQIAVLLNQNAGNATPSASAMDFGTVDIAPGTQGIRTLTFTNQGSGFSRLGAPFISGAAASDYSVTNNGCAGETLLKLEFCSISVGFTPSAHGGRAATLNLPDSPGTRTVPLSGRGRDVTAPVISGLKLSRKRFKAGRKRTVRSAAKAGTKIRYRLSEAATVRLTIQRKRSKKKCVLTRKGKRGANSVAFSGRCGKKRLRTGRYSLVATATDAVGNASAKRRPLRFRIVRR